MNSRKKVIILAGVIFIAIIGILIKVNSRSEIISKETDSNSGKTIAMYIEDDAGEFQPSNQREFPTEGYVLDLEQSTCENGGTLTQNADTKKISLTVNHKTKCKLYFKKEDASVPLTTKLLSQTNDASITEYNSGVKGEMFTFNHPATTQTTGWSEAERTDFRYIGNTPNNYIKFNEETWRIIGVFTVEGENGVKEQRIKIIRDEPIGVLSWDHKSDDTYANEWPSSTLSTMLNGDYVNKGGSFTYTWYNTNVGGSKSTQTSTVQGLNATAKSQIAPTKWYLGGNSTSVGDGSTYYNFERGTKTFADSSSSSSSSSDDQRSTNVVANVGLIYPSDYLYTFANGVDNAYYGNGNRNTCISGTPSSSWLFNSKDQWTITPDSSNSKYVFALIYNSAYYDDDCSEDYNFIVGKYSEDYSINVRPSVYLKSDIKTISGSGAKDNPYVLKN